MTEADKLRIDVGPAGRSWTGAKAKRRKALTMNLMVTHEAMTRGRMGEWELVIGGGWPRAMDAWMMRWNSSDKEGKRSGCFFELVLCFCSPLGASVQTESH